MRADLLHRVPGAGYIPLRLGVQVHEAAGERKGLQMHGGSGKGELGLASSCVLLWVHPSAGNGPLACSGAPCIALGVLLVGLPAHSLPWQSSGVQQDLHHASRCAAGCPEETRGIVGYSRHPLATPGVWNMNP